jgi:hypothetical protein
MQRKAVTLVLVALLLALLSGASIARGASAAPLRAAPATAVCDTGHVYFAKTKFVLHAGLALGVFHRYIYKPFKNGAFTSGSPGRLKAGIKAALAGAFVYHELKLACKDANNSSLLRPLLAPLNLAAGFFSSLEAKLKGGKFSDSTFTTAASAIDGLATQSSGIGVKIPELVTGFSGR